MRCREFGIHPGKVSSVATLYPAESTERFGGPSLSFMALGYFPR